MFFDYSAFAKVVALKTFYEIDTLQTKRHIQASLFWSEIFFHEQFEFIFFPHFKSEPLSPQKCTDWIRDGQEVGMGLGEGPLPNRLEMGG